MCIIYSESESEEKQNGWLAIFTFICRLIISIKILIFLNPVLYIIWNIREEEFESFEKLQVYRLTMLENYLILINMDSSITKKIDAALEGN